MLERVIRRKLSAAGRELAIDHAVPVGAAGLSGDVAVAHVHNDDANGFGADVKSNRVARGGGGCVGHSDCDCRGFARRAMYDRVAMARYRDEQDEAGDLRDREDPDESDMDDEETTILTSSHARTAGR
jgi:hypothetical protein